MQFLAHSRYSNRYGLARQMIPKCSLSTIVFPLTYIENVIGLLLFFNIPHIVDLFKKLLSGYGFSLLPSFIPCHFLPCLGLFTVVAHPLCVVVGEE